MATSNLIVNYLPQGIHDIDLKKIFTTIGPVESVKIMKDIKTGYSYGFGFVLYKLPEDAQRAILQLNGLQLGNKRIKVSYARPNTAENKNTNLYITNVPRHYTEETLSNIFGKFGQIIQVKLLRDKFTGNSSGVAFVRFGKQAEAEAAITEMDGKMLEEKGEVLHVRVAEEYGKKRAAYYIGLQAGLQQGNSAFWSGSSGFCPNTASIMRRNSLRASNFPKEINPRRPFCKPSNYHQAPAQGPRSVFKNNRSSPYPIALHPQNWMQYPVPTIPTGPLQLTATHQNQHEHRGFRCQF